MMLDLFEAAEARKEMVEDATIANLIAEDTPGEKPAKTRQTDRLIKYLTFVGPITPMQAWTQLGIYRLSARIYDAKKRVAIEKNMVTVTNSFGEKCSVAQYRIDT